MLQIYLDLDRTLVKTDVITGALHKALEQLYGRVTVKQISADYPHFRPLVGVQNYYDFFGQVESYGLEADTVEADLRAHITSNDLLYEDALPMLDELDATGLPISILTYGERRFQEFKATLVPRLKPYKVISILEEKAAYLAKHPSPCMLVDDRAATFNKLPAHCIGVLIDRQLKERCVKTNEGFAINSLEIVGELLP